MKRKLADGKYIDVRVLGSFTGWYDEYAEIYFPEEAKKDRLAAIAKLEELIEEFRDTDKDSYEYAVEKLVLAKAAYDNFVDFMKPLEGWKEKSVPRDDGLT